MKNEIKIPSLGESISEAVIGQIFVASGNEIKTDAEILELETDKVNQVLYAPVAGQLELNVKTGDKVTIGQTIGFIESGTEKKEKQAHLEEPSKKQEEPLKKEKPAFQEEATKQAEPLSPLPQIKKTEIASKSNRVTRRPLSRIRKVIAERMVEAQQTMAMLTTFNEADLSHVMSIREEYKEEFIKKHGCKLGLMPFIIKATVSALQAFPILNSYIDQDEIVQREYVNIGVAVGTDKGVIVPVIKDCDQLSYVQIEQAIESFAKQAKDGNLKPDDLQGGGFTITNGGVYGSLLSTPFILPSQCGILGMHKIQKRPVVKEDEIVIRPMMYLALSYDHRLIDGKEAISFLEHIKKMLEDPSRILLEI